MRVLIVEDDDGIARGLVLALRRDGYAADVVPGVARAKAALRTEPFDVVLLDLGLADGDGTDVLRYVRNSPAGRLPDPGMPILIMTARDEVSSRIAGLDMGADDYVTKPFDPGELAARIRVQRRRVAGRAKNLLTHGDLEIDPAARVVRKSGKEVDLSSREFALLRVLVEARPRVLSRAQIEASLYDWGAALDSNAIEVHVHHLRRKLGEGIIHTMRGIGYFVPEDDGA